MADDGAARSLDLNMLRGSIAAFAAGVGGADAITVLPFTAALGLPDPFARRIARNIQLLLLEESNICRVGDPAAGSGGIEDLTQKLAQAAWALFQNIEEAGGAPAALEAGLIQGKVAAVRAEREKAVARRTRGADRHQRLPAARRDAGRCARRASRSRPASYPVYVNLRSRCRASALPSRSSTCATPPIARWPRPAHGRVFLANIGTPAEFNARATFTKNFFEAGGIEAVTNDGFADRRGHEQSLQGVRGEAGLSLLLGRRLCTRAADAAKALATAGSTHIYLGRPTEGCRRGQGRRHRQLHLRRLRSLLAMLTGAHRLLSL